MNEKMEKDKYKELKDAGLTAASATVGAIGSTEVVDKIMAEDGKQSIVEVETDNGQLVENQMQNQTENIVVNDESHVETPPGIQEQEVEVIVHDIDFHQQEIDEMCVLYGGPSDIYPDIGEYIIVDDTLDMYGPDPSVLTDLENDENEIMLMDYEISSVDDIVVLNDASSESENADLQDSDDMGPYVV